jgi:hypothetical protein
MPPPSLRQWGCLPETQLQTGHRQGVKALEDIPCVEWNPTALVIVTRTASSQGLRASIPSTIAQSSIPLG